MIRWIQWQIIMQNFESLQFIVNFEAVYCPIMRHLLSSVDVCVAVSWYVDQQMVFHNSAFLFCFTQNRKNVHECFADSDVAMPIWRDHIQAFCARIKHACVHSNSAGYHFNGPKIQKWQFTTRVANVCNAYSCRMRCRRRVHWMCVQTSIRIDWEWIGIWRKNKSSTK